MFSCPFSPLWTKTCPIWTLLPPLCFSPSGPASRGEGRCWVGSGHHDLKPLLVQAADSSRDTIRTGSGRKPQELGAKDLHVMKVGLGVRATQGTPTLPGTEGWRVSRVRGWQRIGPKKPQSFCWQELTCVGPNGEAPTIRAKVARRERKLLL